MEFHRRAIEWFGQPGDAVDPERRAWLHHLAATLNVRLPAAVAEWISLPETSRLWQRYVGCDHSAIHFYRERQPWLERAQREGDALIEDRQRPGWWHFPRPREDLRGWIRGPILPIVYAHQGSCWFGCFLDGSDDPAVLMAEYDRGEAWDHYAGSFADFVQARLFDHAMDTSGETRRTVEVDEAVGTEALRDLRTRFRSVATTRDGDRWFTHRFVGDGQRFRLTVRDGDGRSAGTSVWNLWAADPARFGTLVEAVDGVCERLRGVTPDGPSPLYLRQASAVVDEPEGGPFPF